MKNILILGASRTGKTSLAKRLSRAFGYGTVCLDDLVGALQQAYPQLGVSHDIPDAECIRALEPFLHAYLKRLIDAADWGRAYVIEGVYVDLERLLSRFPDAFWIVGLSLGGISAQRMAASMKARDTPQDWTYEDDDAQRLGNAEYFIEQSRAWEARFRGHGIEYFITSGAREEAFDRIERALARRMSE